MADRMSADDLNKRLRAIDNIRMAGVSEERDAQLKAEAKVYRDQLNTLNAVQGAFGGEAAPAYNAIDPRFATPEGGYPKTPISPQGKIVEQKKKRYYELEEKGRFNRSDAENAEMAQLGHDLNDF